MGKILLFFQCSLLVIFGSLLILCLYFAILVALFFNCGTDNQKESIWKGEINASWYDNSQTEFTITTAEQLAGFARLVNNGKDFKGKTVNLGANIDLKKKDWTPIGNFRGTFDGKGFVVSGLYINAGQSGYGLFGANNGTIKNLGIIDSYVGGDFIIGGLAGKNNGRIENCYFSGTVGLKSDGGGGLVGENFGVIKNSYSTGKVIRLTSCADSIYNFGGLVGENLGVITNSYSTSVVTGVYNVGGLVGSNSNKGTIENSYSSGKANGSNYVGGLVGNNGGIGEKVEGKTTAEMKQKSTFVGWDFDNVWEIDGKVNGGYPFLRNR